VTFQFAHSNFPRYLFAAMDKVLGEQGVTQPSIEVAPVTTADVAPERQQ